MQKVFCLCDSHLRLHLCKGRSDGQQDDNYETRLLPFWWCPRRSKLQVCRCTRIAETHYQTKAVRPYCIHRQPRENSRCQTVNGICYYSKLKAYSIFAYAEEQSSPVRLHCFLVQQEVQQTFSFISTYCKRR